MAVATPLKTAMHELSDEHRQWLSSFDPRYLKNWEKMLEADDEASLTEAAVRRMLQRHGVAVEPNEGLSGVCGGPDFRCTANGNRFYVEATCITCAVAVKRSGIVDGTSGPAPFNVMGMNEAVFSEIQGKASQCRDLDGPALVAVGTFHSTAAMVCFKKALVSRVLTGETKMAWGIDASTGQQVGDTHDATQLRAAGFLRPDKTLGVSFARHSVSGVLLCAVGLEDKKPLGILHPNPIRPFDPTLLPDIEFGIVKVDSTSMRLQAKWPGGDD
jgi:hypothetical protein